ncbi:MAG: AbrB/MazE/SpoVT family DNA-binding domain-containing protein [Caldilineaceae bacterium]|nr:AbrB/MazE/SpoVT family DNA-binding domain-containing protein [Caldilineaceae bacterium]
MTTSLTTRIIPIGNSQGIRIPKALFQQLGVTDEVTLEAQAGQLIIRPLTTARNGWDEQFQAMAAAGNDQLLDEELLLTEWEENEWPW